MPNLIKKSWTVSTQGPTILVCASAQCANATLQGSQNSNCEYTYFKPRAMTFETC